MKFDEFQKSLTEDYPSEQLSRPLQSLWYDARGDWNKAHGIIQDIDDKTAAWIHAYLHRKEGDIGNADYWCRRADKIRPGVTVEEEWRTIVKELL